MRYFAQVMGVDFAPALISVWDNEGINRNTEEKRKTRRERTQKRKRKTKARHTRIERRRMRRRGKSCGRGEKRDRTKAIMS